MKTEEQIKEQIKKMKEQSTAEFGNSILTDQIRALEWVLKWINTKK